jgi:transposase InsO family protein
LAKNLIKDLQINQPNQVWVSDFTYLPYQNKFLYLATILDAFTREVIAWNIASRHNKELITTTLLDAINKRERPPNIFHSDQGSEYRSDELANILTKQNIKASMSKKSSPWQNGKQESFYQKLKFELEDFNSYNSQGELIEAIAIQIHYYNNKRIHSALKMPPNVFYQRFMQKNIITKNQQNSSKNFEPLHLSYA